MSEPSPDDLAKLFEPSSQFESAIASIFTDAGGITAVTPATAGEDLQKTRPRIELKFEVTGEKQGYAVFDDGTKRNASYTGQLTFQLIAPTVAGSDGTPAFRQYLAMFAWLMSNMAARLNGNDDAGDAYMPYHEVQRILGNAYAPAYEYEKGFLVSKPVYAVDFGIDHGAWVEVGLTVAA